MRFSLDDINQLDQIAFVELLGAIFEATPSIAAQVWPQRPFQDISDLHSKMAAIVDHMPLVDQLALIKAHPELGSRGKMADASVQEQTNAGLNGMNRDQYERLASLNKTYRQKYGFPFVMAVKGHDQTSIATALENRLNHTQGAEIQQALGEICKIAQFRLQDLIQDNRVPDA